MKALILLSSLGIISLFAEIFHFKKYLFTIVLIGLLATIYVTITEWGYNNTYYYMMKMDSLAVCFNVTILSTAFLWFVMSNNYIKEKTNITDHFALVLFSLVGAVLLTSYSNLTMLFLGVEILSIPLYVLAASKKDDLFSNEAGFKYFLMGAFASGFLLFGIALIYGTTASFDLQQIANYVEIHNRNIPGLFYTGILLTLVGLAFKISAAPFHFWAPDVYQGSPTVVTAFMSTIVKTAVFAAFMRLFKTCFVPVNDFWASTIMIMSALTMIVGNVTAVYQTNVKRMLAYSSISHAGFMLIAILSMNGLSNGSILYYTIAYSLSSIGAFAIVYIVSTAKSDENIDAFNGLAKSNPVLALGMTIVMLSLAGIPPLAGFFAKYYIFVSAVQSHFVGLVIIAVISSLIGVYYYFKIIIAMYFKEPSNESIKVDGLHNALLVVIIIAIFAVGLFPGLIIQLI